MGLLEKMKNLFTEELEEEKPIKKETRQVEINRPVKPEIKETRETRESRNEQLEKEEKKEEKFVFFSDDDFKDLEKRETVKPKPLPKREEKPLAYKGATPQAQVNGEEKKSFKPSPIISPVYGVLDKNYEKDEIVSKRIVRSYKPNDHVTVDDVRNKAFGTIEDDLKDSILGKKTFDTLEDDLNEIDIFEELDKLDNVDSVDNSLDTKEGYEDIFGELDNKKEEILDELDSKKEQILDELDNKKGDIIIDEEEILSSDIDLKSDIDDEEEINNIDESNDKEIDLKEEIEKYDSVDESDDMDSAKEDDDLLDEETELLSRQLEHQKKKLDEINDMMNDADDDDENLNDDELFDIIDSMYEKKDDE